jgi:uncharacterized protein (TIGR03435 family)
VILKHKTPAFCLAACALLIPSHLPAQVPSTVPIFEVSTVKPSKTDNPNSRFDFRPRQISAENLPVMYLVQYAYNLSSGSDDQIIGAPGWLRSARFDIVANEDDATITELSKMSDDERTATVRLMLQALLADRFHLKIHHETRPLPVIVLTLANPASTNDPKLTPAPAPSTVHDWSGLHNDGPGHIEARGIPLTLLVSMLANQPEIAGRLVLDQTHLTGNYNFTLSWTPQQLAETTDNGSSTPAGPSLFAALPEQLGLKLKSTKAPIDVVVIDHIDPPTPN